MKEAGQQFSLGASSTNRNNEIILRTINNHNPRFPLCMWCPFLIMTHTGQCWRFKGKNYYLGNHKETQTMYFYIGLVSIALRDIIDMRTLPQLC